MKKPSPVESGGHTGEAILRERGPIVLSFCFFPGFGFDCDLCGVTARMEALCGSLALDPGALVCWECIERLSGDGDIARRLRALLDEFRLREMPVEGNA